MDTVERESVGIGARLKELRQAKGWTQEMLAENAGVGRGHIAKIESGEIKLPRSESLEKLALALEVEPKELIRAGRGIHAAEELIRLLENRDRSEIEKLIEMLRPFRGGAADHREQSVLRDTPNPFMPFEVPPEKFVEGDYDYMQTYRSGEHGLLGGSSAGDFDEIDTSGESAELLNPTLRDVQSGRYGVVRVKGRSMEPKLHDGDLVLIDTFDKKPGLRRIMAVYRKGDGSALGYIHRVGDLSILTKANAAEFSPIILPEDAIIQGVVKKRLEEALE